LASFEKEKLFGFEFNSTHDRRKLLVAQHIVSSLQYILGGADNISLHKN